MEHMPRCSIRCRRRGHWVHGKIFKRFAFLACYVVEDAYRTLQAVDGKLCTFSGHSRHIVAYPAVECGRIVYSRKWEFQWMIGSSICEWVLYGWDSNLHRYIHLPLYFGLDDIRTKVANASRISPKLQPELKWLVMVKRRLIVQLKPEFRWRYMVYRHLIVQSRQFRWRYMFYRLFLCRPYDVHHYQFISKIICFLGTHPDEWTKEEHWGCCGQACPCCRAAHCEVFGACELCYKIPILTWINRQWRDRTSEFDGKVMLPAGCMCRQGTSPI